MRVFLIDKYGKNYDIVKNLKGSGIENIEAKENCKMRLTKNDTVILLEDSDIEGLSKTAKVIWISPTKSPKQIWKFINEYNCVDIIDANMDREYIVKRIIRNVC